MDNIDQNIIRNLLLDGKTTNARLASAVGLSESATLGRVRRLERTGVIRGYAAQVDPADVGRGLEVLMTFVLKNQSPADIRRFMRAMERLDEVLTCAQVLGRFDFVAHVAVADIGTLQRFINEKLVALGCIDRMESLTVLKMVKRFHPPLPTKGT